MPISARRNFSKGATVVVEAHGEVLFMPTGPVYGWSRRFANAVQRGTQAAAPVNKRPRWAHYGKPLKESITSTTPRYRQTPGGARLYAAVGSTAPYAVYVDQGTGIHGGNGAYEAKILPPTAWGAPNLYEKTWIPPGSSKAVGRVMIDGQRGQGFFAKGLKRGFEQMRMRSYQVPADPRIGAAMDDFPSALSGLVTANLSKAAFKVQLDDWRLWRDAAWKSHSDLSGASGPGTFTGRRKFTQDQIRSAERANRMAAAREMNRQRQARWRAKNKVDKVERRASNKQARADARESYVKRLIDKYGANRVDANNLHYENGHWTGALVLGRGKDGRPEWHVAH